jgi:DNA-binding NarL/FixJ family response regulator
MIRVYVATAKPEIRAAIRTMLLDLDVEVVGEASDWFTTLAQASTTNFNVLLVDWDILPMNAVTGLLEIRRACTYAVIVVLISQLDASKQAALADGADAFISTNEIPDLLVKKLHLLAENIENASAH